MIGEPTAEFKAEIEALRKEFEERVLELAAREIARIFARARAKAAAEAITTSASDSPKITVQ